MCRRQLRVMSGAGRRVVGSIQQALWITARRYKQVLGRVLAELSDDGFCTPKEAHRVGELILHDNAVRLYDLRVSYSHVNIDSAREVANHI